MKRLKTAIANTTPFMANDHKRMGFTENDLNAMAESMAGKSLDVFFSYTNRNKFKAQFVSAEVLGGELVVVVDFEDDEISRFIMPQYYLLPEMTFSKIHNVLNLNVCWYTVFVGLKGFSAEDFETVEEKKADKKEGELTPC